MKDCIRGKRAALGVVAAILALSMHPGHAFAAPLPAGDLETMGLEDLMNIPVYAASRREQKSTGGQEHVQDAIPQDGRTFRLKATASF